MTKKNAEDRKLRVTYNAPVTLTFVIICTVIMLLDSYVFKHLFSRVLFICPGSSQSAHPFNWKQPLDYFRLFSHVFGHSDWNHLIANMYLILLLGPTQEDRYGPPVFAFMLTVTALVTGIINAGFISVPRMGASDIVFMMIFLTSYTSLTKKEIPLSFIFVFILYSGGQFYSAKTLQTDILSIISHIAGGLCGSLLAFLSVPKNNDPKMIIRQRSMQETRNYTDKEKIDDDIAGPSPRTSGKAKKNKSPRNDNETVVGTLNF
ncbi:MAG: rhomboid family intramembrane serine protease [Treponema sp.]